MKTKKSKRTVTVLKGDYFKYEIIGTIERQLKRINRREYDSRREAHYWVRTDSFSVQYNGKTYITGRHHEIPNLVIWVK